MFMKLKITLVFMMSLIPFMVKSDNTIDYRYSPSAEGIMVYSKPIMYPSPVNVQAISGNIFTMYPIIYPVNPEFTAIWTDGREYYYGGLKYGGFWPWNSDWPLPCPPGAECPSPVGTN